MTQIKAYHGGPHKLDKWDYEKIGANATMEGYGFYFTSDYNIAKGYANGGFLYQVNLTFNKPFFIGKRILKYDDIVEMLRVFDESGDGFLSNYGDVSYEGYESVLDTSARVLDENNEDDIDVINEIFRSSPYNINEFYTMMRDKFGYDSIVAKDPNWGGNQRIYIAWFNDQISITKVEDFSEEKDNSVNEIHKIIQEEIEAYFTDMEVSLDNMKGNTEEKVKFLKRVKDVVPSEQPEEKRAKKAQFDQAEEELEQITQMEKDLEDQKAEQEKLANTPQNNQNTDIKSLTQTQSFTSN